MTVQVFTTGGTIASSVDATGSVSVSLAGAWYPMEWLFVRWLGGQLRDEYG